ncbi:MAG TPA: hypothetical protein PK156_12210 [Polyangium sp.]|nr:hypothetical protein [Polyangium sp.]
MKRFHRITRMGLALGIVGLAAALPFFATYTAQAGADAGTDAGADASADAAVEVLPVVKGADIPTEASKAPTEAEWKDAKKVTANRFIIDERPEAGRCELRLLREWLRVNCRQKTGASLIAGDPKGVTMWTTGNTFSDEDRLARVTVTTPLAKGKSQLYTLLSFAFGYDSTRLGEGGAMSIEWREGMEDPNIVIWLESPWAE